MPVPPYARLVAGAPHGLRRTKVPAAELGPGRRACIIKGVTRRSLFTSSDAPDSAAASAATAVTEPSNVARETALVSAALDSATPAALLAGAIDVEQRPAR